MDYVSLLTAVTIDATCRLTQAGRKSGVLSVLAK
jgi:hypothetical protein